MITSLSSAGGGLGLVGGPPGLQGPPGLSAYQIAVQNGYLGTIQQWLASLVGPVGPSASAVLPSLAQFKRALSAAQFNAVSDYVTNTFNQTDPQAIEWANGRDIAINGFVCNLVKTALGLTDAQVLALYNAALASEA